MNEDENNQIMMVLKEEDRLVEDKQEANIFFKEICKIGRMILMKIRPKKTRKKKFCHQKIAGQRIIDADKNWINIKMAWMRKVS